MSLKPFKTFLQESLIDVDKSDVDKIYAPLKKPMKELSAVWEKHIDRYKNATAGSPGKGVGSERDAIARTISRELYEVLQKHSQNFVRDPRRGALLKTIKSSELKSELAKKAHSVNPIEINVWLIGPEGTSNNYNPGKKTIDIHLPASVAEAMLNRLITVPYYQIPSLMNEVSEIKHKTTIRHELTHWIDDSLHNFHIKRSMERIQDIFYAGDRKGAEKAWKAMLNHGEEDIYLSSVEITPMVNQIAEYKRRVTKKRWDSITWSDLMVDLPSLGALNERLGQPWRKKMFTRLARENLIGKNFRAKLE